MKSYAVYIVKRRRVMINVKTNNDNIDSIKKQLEKAKGELKLYNFLFEMFHESVEKN